MSLGFHTTIVFVQLNCCCVKNVGCMVVWIYKRFDEVGFSIMGDTLEYIGSRSVGMRKEGVVWMGM
jgi:hypothetical protein